MNIYPKILFIALGRINEKDNANNGLLIRNLFNRWPREHLAQIYSSGNNSDAGFFGRYYEMCSNDRRFGDIFYSRKAKIREDLSKSIQSSSSDSLSFFRNKVIDSGIYEYIFRPRLSQEIISFVQDFKPDYIFTQGYNLTFSWLTLMISDFFNLPTIYYPTDDWPSYLYNINEAKFVSRFTRKMVTSSSLRLVQNANIRIAFNSYMKEEYLQRYGFEFSVLMQGDNFERFDQCPVNNNAEHVYQIICTGDFDDSRAPLLTDLEHACKHLNEKGIKTRASVFPVNMRKLSNAVSEFDYVDFYKCPTHESLVPILRNADILFLPERFDKTVTKIKLSISSKAHLFMFSGRPIVVYSDPTTGISRYAREAGWAIVVDRRDHIVLADAFEKLLTDDRDRQRIITNARQTAIKNHHLPTIQSSLLSLIHEKSGPFYEAAK